MRISGTEYGRIVKESWIIYQEAIIREGGVGEFNRSSYEEAMAVNRFFSHGSANENRKVHPIWAKPPSGPLVGPTTVAFLEDTLEMIA